MQIQTRLSEALLIHEDLLVITSQERDLTDKVLKQLHRIEKKRFYIDLGYSSLFDYCTKGLKYSEGAASRRIRAARLTCDLPETSEQIKAGALTLSNLAVAQSMIRAEEKRTGAKVSIERRREVVHQLENKSQTQAEAALAHTF